MCRTSFHVCYYGSPHQGGPYQSLTGSCLLLYHLFHSLFCTIDVPMYTAGESVFYWRSDGSLVPATVLGPGAQSETVQIEYKRNERLVRHPAALIANLSRPIPTIPDSPEWDSAPSRSPSPPPRTRPMERSAKRRPRHSAPPSVRPVQIQPEMLRFTPLVFICQRG